MAIQRYRDEHGLKRKSDLPTSINPEAIVDDYKRFYYGRDWRTKDEFVAGSVRSLVKKTKAIIFDIIVEYLRLLKENRLETYDTRRERWLEIALSPGNPYAKKFTYVFVDEFQDCSKADLKILLSLVTDRNRITIAGDLAQSVHLGRTAELPKDDEFMVQEEEPTVEGDPVEPREPEGEESDEERLTMKRWKAIPLTGSYRLPYRVSDCLKPLSERLKERNKGEPIYSYPVVLQELAQY